MATNGNATSTPDISSSEPLTWVLILYVGILPTIWIAPIVYSCWKRKRSRAPPPINAPASTSGHSSIEVAKLQAAEQSRKRLHERVNDTIWQLGWMLMLSLIHI